MADDIAALLAHLRIERADVMGYSLGGGVAFQTAIRHPTVVRRLVMVSSVVRSGAYYPEIRAQQLQVGAAMANAMKGTPMHSVYMSVAPRKEDFLRRGGRGHVPPVARGGGVRPSRRWQA